MAGGALVAALAVLAVVLVWFQPQQLVLDETVDEAAPMAAPAAPAAAPAEDAPTDFVSLDHTTTGVARVVDAGDGKRVVRLESLATDNGPDLYLYLSTNPPDGDEQAFDDEVVNLGRLKGTRGDQNYEVPADVDLDRYASVVIWCDRFNSAFGAAPLA